MIRAGSMRHILSIEERTLYTTPEGEEIEIWSEINQVRASITPINGTESFITDTIKNEVSHKIGIRYQPLTPTKHRFVLNGRIFTIINILDFQEKKVNLLILVNENIL